MPEDCFLRDRKNPEFDPRETSRSVSEMKEWVCSKIDRPDGTTTKDCMRLYTGGEAFRVCYSSYADGSTCLCSSELCNGGEGGSGLKSGSGQWATVALAIFVVLRAT